MIFAHEPLKRDLRNARRILWLAFTLELFAVTLSNLNLGFGVYALLVCAFSVTLLLSYYLLFLGFSRMAKHFHSMHIFWLFIAEIMFAVFFAVFDVIEKLAFYGGYDPYLEVATGITLITGAILIFLYGYYIMELPQKKFGNILFAARVANIGKALLMTALVYVGAMYSGGSTSLLYSFIALGNFVLIIVCNAIDYAILGKALRIVGGVLPHPAPTPRHH